MPNFEGEYHMPQQASEIEQEKGQFGEIARGKMGEKSIGSFGPSSEKEAVQVNDYSRPEYSVIANEESHCMDDRGEGLCVQLAGNRAHSEIIGDYTNIHIPAETISVMTAKKTMELVGKAKKPYYHGDKTSGKKGCAAVLYGREALKYMGENPDQVAGMAYDRLRLVGIDGISKDELAMRARIGGERAADDTLWDADSEKLVEIAQENGAAYEEFDGAHHTAGPREDMSPHGFNNQRFRDEHTTDDGYPLGVLSLTYGKFVEQLREENLLDEEIANKVAGVMLFQVTLLKLACSPEAVDVIVGYGVVD
jgi:hypothetical protein